MTVATSTVTTGSKYRTAVAASTIYLGCEVLRMAAGFVSMPILTRALTRDEYGLLNLSFAAVGILALLGRLGFAEATTRFYYEYKQRGSRELREFCGSMVAGAFAMSTVVMLITLLVLQWWTTDANKRACLQIAASIIVVRAVLGVVFQIYRAAERPIACAGAQVAARYASLCIVIALVLIGRVSAYAVLAATVFGESIIALLTLVNIRRSGGVGRPRWTRLHSAAAFSYGAPLAVGLYATFFLDFGDRFLIERYLGLGAVASYSVPYDLINTITSAICGSLKLAVMPVVFRLAESEGPRITSAFVSRTASYAIAIALPAAVLYIAISEDLIVFLSSAKYSGAGQLSRYLVPGIVAGELNFLFASGLLIAQCTKTLAALTVVSSGLNLLLNVVLLPRLGLAGAAWATTLAYGVLGVATYVASRQVFELKLDRALIASGIATTAVMLTILSTLPTLSMHPAVNLAFRASVGGWTALLCMCAFNSDIRQQVWTRVRALAVR